MTCNNYIHFYCFVISKYCIIIELTILNKERSFNSTHSFTFLSSQILHIQSNFEIEKIKLLIALLSLYSL